MNNETFLEITEEMSIQMEKWQKALVRYSIPEDRSLANALATLSKAELDDIRCSLYVQGISSLKKQELAKALVSFVLNFSQKWFVTIVMDQYKVLNVIEKSGGLSTEIGVDDTRIDYMRCLGLLHSGTVDGKQAWYLPNEILGVYSALNSDKAYKAEVELNEEAVRLATGLVFYYGYLQYDVLFKKVNEFLKKKLSFVDFMGILTNASCWQGNIINVDSGVHYYTVFDYEFIVDCQIKRSDIDFFPFSYKQVYRAGAVDYIEKTDTYKDLVSFFVKKFSMSTLEAADIVGEINMILQNGDLLSDMLEYIEDQVPLTSVKIVEQLAQILLEFNNTSPLWLLKGYSPNLLYQNSVDRGKGNVDNLVKFVLPNSTIGRNDPCLCGSGKKYKKCCIDKI